MSYTYERTWALQADNNLASLTEDHQTEVLLDVLSHGNECTSDTSEWVCQAISGHGALSFEACAPLLTLKATNTPAFAESQSPTLSAVIGFDAGKPYVAEISNFDVGDKAPPLPVFTIRSVQALTKCIGLGFGQENAVPPLHRDAMLYSATEHRAEPTRHLQVLANINREASGIAGGTSSDSCTVSYLPYPMTDDKPFIHETVWWDDTPSEAFESKLLISHDGLNVSRISRNKFPGYR